jgi:hypothetical protein
LEPIDVNELRWAHLDVPKGVAQPLYALPFVVRHEMLGFVLYGGHVGGEALDPDERNTLQRVALAAAAAYEHVRTKSIIAEANDLRIEVVLLAKEQHLLREMVDALRAATAAASK